MDVRRVVTGVAADGSATFLSDEPTPRARDLVHTPGMSFALVWATEPGDTLADAGADRSTGIDFVPGPGGTQMMLVTFPPGAVFAAPDFDPAAAAGELMEVAPGLAERFEPDSPGKHTTPTVDYVIVIEGEVWLELDNGEETCLRPGDVVVQNAARHAWTVRGAEPATVALVMVGLPDRQLR